MSPPSGVGQRSYWPRGKVLGGTSSVNGMVYIRGSRHDFDKWVKDGSEGWSYKDVLPYFLKSEDVQEKSLQASSESAPIEYHHLNIVHCILTVSFI